MDNVNFNSSSGLDEKIGTFRRVHLLHLNVSPNRYAIPLNHHISMYVE